MKIKKWEIALFAALLLIFISGISAQTAQSELADKVIRLHVIANSDSAEDQVQKLKVRDAVLLKVKNELAGCADRNEALDAVTCSLGEIAVEAQGILDESGEGRSAYVTFDIEDYPTRDYGTFALPAGRYKSLRVVIGEGGGRNWWCVLFPTLCAAAAETPPDDASIGLDDGDISLITRDGAGYAIKFRLIELISDIKGLFE